MEDYEKSVECVREMGGDIVEHGTVSFRTTTFGENMTDLMHLFANTAFVAGFTETEAIENAKNVIQEQYLQCILKSTPDPLPDNA